MSIKEFLTNKTNRGAEIAWNYIKSDVMREVEKEILLDRLKYVAYTNKEIGISSECVADKEVVVSLSTHGKRLFESYLAIETIMNGTILPNRIVLWLGEDMKNSPLPRTIQGQIKRGLEVRYTEDIRAYTKLLPSLKAFPDSIIVTIDDDILYPEDTLEQLLLAHTDCQSAICANCVKRVTPNGTGALKSILTWESLEKTEFGRRDYFFEGFGGVLYPPHCFSGEIMNKDIFWNICQYADDVWYNVIAYKENIPVMKPSYHYGLFPYMENDSVPNSGLKVVNNNPNDCKNDIQIRNVFDHYNLMDKLLSDCKEDIR